jgi:putative ABC transport system permease protein
VWLPVSSLLATTPPAEAGYYQLIARSTTGVSLQQMRDDATRVLHDIEGANYQGRVSVTRLDETLTAAIRPVVEASLAAALLVLLVACANVAMLLMSQTLGRRREIAARMALGASSGRLIRGVVVETLVIAAAGSLLGVGLAALTLHVFVRQATGILPRVDEVALT